MGEAGGCDSQRSVGRFTYLLIPIVGSYVYQLAWWEE
jgi:hypothetical protein